MGGITYPPGQVALSVQHSGSTNDSSSGSGAFIDHTPTFTLPANSMTAGRAFRVTAHFQGTTGSAPPTLTYRLRLGATDIYSSAVQSVSVSLTNVQFILQWVFQATQAPGPAANVQCGIVAQVNSPNSVSNSVTAMPVAIATNAAQSVTIGTKWTAAGTGTSTIGLNQLIVEALN